jgi:hypothetical protein
MKSKSGFMGTEKGMEMMRRMMNNMDEDMTAMMEK